ncbi:plasmid partitioning protein RepB [Paracoccus sp. Z330]|uniref:Plasmid partitioning protein RepB n=1 Tax=Paracoccus onchidii TaxID=3017813 RepID=A0ABT4ZJN1_9RHOB|nr:plasmid partitioning protein RepB [Paracoccus onchidii]MDB6179523.1 plasmid partitioning protein RepB [Paracoccus onchidii]
MSESRKKRLAALDGLAQAGTAAPPSMMGSNRALRSARNAVDSHRIWELNPDQIQDDRKADRMEPGDIEDLRQSIESIGQTVPILVRRDPNDNDRYLLVYGRRRLEAVRASNQVAKVRAMIASMDDREAISAQASENTARRDLSFIERALFAQQLLESGYGTQTEVAEVLNVTKSAISMSLSVARAVDNQLAQAIGPAHGVGRPRWESLVNDLTETAENMDDLISLASRVRQETSPDVADPSVTAFDAVSRRLRKRPKPDTASAPLSQKITLGKVATGRINRTSDGIRLNIKTSDKEFADWIAQEVSGSLEDLHTRWKKRG